MATARASRVLCGTALRVADLDCMQTVNAGASTRGAAAVPLSTCFRLADVVAPVGHTWTPPRTPGCTSAPRT